MIIKSISPLLVLLSLGLVSCNPEAPKNDNVRKGSGSSDAVSDDGDGDGDDGFTEPEKVDPFDDHAERFEEAFKAYASACIANTQISGNEGINFFTGYVDANTTFSNYSYIQLFCDGGDMETLASLDEALFQMDPVRYEALYQSLVEESGLGQHFQDAVEQTTVTAGAGITISDQFWASEQGASFFVATFDAAAATPVDTPTTITFAYGEQSIQSNVTVYEYTAQQVTDGATLYQTNCAGCHAQETGADHSPLTIGTCSDIEIAGAITAGSYAVDAANPNSACAQDRALKTANHSYALPEADVSALIVHLRTLDLPFGNQEEEEAAQ